MDQDLKKVVLQSLKVAKNLSSLLNGNKKLIKSREKKFDKSINRLYKMSGSFAQISANNYSNMYEKFLINKQYKNK